MEEFLNAASDVLINAMVVYNQETNDNFARNNLYQVIDKLRGKTETSILISNISTALEAGDNLQVIRIIERTIWRLKDIHEIEFENLREPEGGNVDPAYIVIVRFEGVDTDL